MPAGGGNAHGLNALTAMKKENGLHNADIEYRVHAGLWQDLASCPRVARNTLNPPSARAWRESQCALMPAVWASQHPQAGPHQITGQQLTGNNVLRV